MPPGERPEGRGGESSIAIGPAETPGPGAGVASLHGGVQHVIERLRSEYNDDEIPGMLITGDTAPDRLREAQESGLLLLHKPVNNSRLRTAINHLVMAHQARLAEPSPPVSG